MVNYREILRLKRLNYSMRQIAVSIHNGRDTISEVIKLAEEHVMEWPLPLKLSNKEIRNIFYPQRKSSLHRHPDCQMIHREMKKPSVNLTLLWSEYCDVCYSEGSILLQYT